MSTDALLNERGSTHGDFTCNALYAQQLRTLFRSSPQWIGMRPEHREALDMAATKLSRILSGQASFDDHWIDLIGYFTLALKASAPNDREDDKISGVREC